MELYHKDIRLPDGYRRLRGRVHVTWSRHAQRARQDDRYGVIPHFRFVNLEKWEVVEVGMEKGELAKILLRGRISNSDLDICVVLIPGISWLVKTVWLNERNDDHRTLDRSRYVC